MYKESKHKNHYLPKFYQEQKEIALQLSPGKMNDITVDVSTFIPTSDEFCKSEQSYEAECFKVYVNGLQNQIAGPNFLLKWLQEWASVFKKYYFKCEGVHLQWILWSSVYTMHVFSS